MAAEEKSYVQIRLKELSPSQDTRLKRFERKTKRVSIKRVASPFTRSFSKGSRKLDDYEYTRLLNAAYRKPIKEFFQIIKRVPEYVIRKSLDPHYFNKYITKNRIDHLTKVDILLRLESLLNLKLSDKTTITDTDIQAEIDDIEKKTGDYLIEVRGPKVNAKIAYDLQTSKNAKDLNDRIRDVDKKFASLPRLARGVKSRKRAKSGRTKRAKRAKSGRTKRAKALKV